MRKISNQGKEQIIATQNIMTQTYISNCVTIFINRPATQVELVGYVKVQAEKEENALVTNFISVIHWVPDS